MSTSAVCLNGEAPQTGFEIFRIPQGSSASANSRLDPGTYIWTENVKNPYCLYSRSDEADLALNSLLNARTENQLGAFSSKYGFLTPTYQHRGGECAPVAGIRAVVDDLSMLDKTLKAGNFNPTNPLPNGLIVSPFAVSFNFWLLPTVNPPGFSPVLMTFSLYSFLAHEVITRALANRPLLVCHACGDFLRSARRDTKFCSGRCRTAFSRGLDGARATRHLGTTTT